MCLVVGELVGVLRKKIGTARPNVLVLEPNLLERRGKSLRADGGCLIRGWRVALAGTLVVCPRRGLLWDCDFKDNVTFGKQG